MRNDLKSMNPGKLAAQASHATSIFTLEGERTLKDFAGGNYGIANLVEQYLDWTEQTPYGFGTVVVLSVNKHDIKSIRDWLFERQPLKIDTLLAGNVIDPSYPARIDSEFMDLLRENGVEVSDSGKVHREEETGMYLFVDADNIEYEWLKAFPLWP